MSTYSLFLVISQFMLMGILAWSSKVVLWHPLLIVIQLLGVVIAVWGILTIKIGNFNVQPEVKSETLICKGPYVLLRNPMYTGIILIFLPTTILNPKPFVLFCYGFLIIVLTLKVYREEHFLEQRFGNDYVHYKKNTWRLIPFIF